MLKTKKMIFIIFVCALFLIGKSAESHAWLWDCTDSWEHFWNCEAPLSEEFEESESSEPSEPTASCDNTISFDYLHCKTSADGDSSDGDDCENQTNTVKAGDEVTIEWTCRNSCDTDIYDTTYYYILYTYSYSFDGTSPTITKDPHYLWGDLSFTVPSDAPDTGTYYIKCSSLDGSETHTKTINFKVRNQLSGIDRGIADIGIVNTLTDNDADGYTSSEDCNDNDADVHPGATEVCDDETDQDCDGIDASSTWYIDSDGDGYGITTTSQNACSQPTGYVSNASDCDDTSTSINPGATDTCDDAIDQDCSGSDSSCEVDVGLSSGGTTTSSSGGGTTVSGSAAEEESTSSDGDSGGCSLSLGGSGFSWTDLLGLGLFLLVPLAQRFKSH